MCVISVFVHDGPEEVPGNSLYIALLVKPNGTTEDIVRTTDWQVAIDGAEAAARRFGVAVEDLS